MDFNGEQGLLGLAFHPNYSQNRRIFLNYDRILNAPLQAIDGVINAEGNFVEVPLPKRGRTSAEVTLV